MEQKTPLPSPKSEEGPFMSHTQIPSASKSCLFSDEDVAKETIEEEDSGRERLKRLRVEVAGRVWIPDLWGQEDLLKDWIDCSAFHAPFVPKTIMTARAALIGKGRERVVTLEHIQRFRGNLRNKSDPINQTMDLASRRSRGGGLLESLYKVIMRRNSVYVTFIIAGAFVGERAVDYGVHKLWEYNNVGKRYEDIPTLGQRQTESEDYE
ncbi:cytochrome b-c1 complex subunit 9-like [Senna tora]|uniref:Complex III subunit 9 n=1 Tax=Senna tora TaxID=362788 RepID=A0A834TBS2_9FABA|nr:cytochrome b-c1 complex subunit 9-like [Senna tora]